MTAVAAVDPGSPGMAAFVKLPYRLHGGSAGYAPPLQAEIERQLSPANPFFGYGEMQCFLGARDAVPVARCAAIHNRRLRHEGEPVGLVGFFDSDGDDEAAQAVLAASVQWLRSRGLRRIWGPMNFSIFHSYRLMTEGFDTEPFYGEPRNPAAHPAMLEHFGFRPLMHWRGWDLDVEDLRTRFEHRPFRGYMARRGFGLREVDLARFEQELAAFHAVVVDSFRDNLAFTEIDLEEFVSLYGGLRHVLRPELIPLVQDSAGNPVACAFIIPDIAPALRLAQGDAARFRHALGATSSGSRVVLHSIAVRPSARARGLVQGFGAHCTERILAMGFRTAVAAMVKPGFSVFERTRQSGRRYTLYELAP